MIRLWLIDTTRECNLNSETQTPEALESAFILIYPCEINFLYYALLCTHFIHIVLIPQKEKKNLKVQ